MSLKQPEILLQDSSFKPWNKKMTGSFLLQKLTHFSSFCQPIVYKVLINLFLFKQYKQIHNYKSIELTSVLPLNVELKLRTVEYADLQKWGLFTLQFNGCDGALRTFTQVLLSSRSLTLSVSILSRFGVDPRYIYYDSAGLTGQSQSESFFFFLN